MTPKLLLIDALNLIRRVHAAVRAPDEYSQVDGAISSTLSSLARAINHYQPTHTLMVFDGNPPTWRHKLYPEYKEGRKPMPETLRVRLGDFNQAILQQSIKTFRKSGLEADDVIAAVASKAANAGIEVRILSTDRVFLQLLSIKNIHLRDHFHKVDFDQQSVVQEFGLNPEQLVDFWSIAGVGDVPGVHGVGDKGAKGLMEEHQNLDAILALGEAATGAAKKVIDQQDQARMCQKLAALAVDLELGIRLRDLRYESGPQ